MQALCAVCVTVTLMTHHVQNSKNRTTTGDKRKKADHFLNSRPGPRATAVGCIAGREARAAREVVGRVASTWHPRQCTLTPGTYPLLLPQFLALPHNCVLVHTHGFLAFSAGSRQFHN